MLICQRAQIALIDRGAHFASEPRSALLVEAEVDPAKDARVVDVRGDLLEFGVLVDERRKVRVRDRDRMLARTVEAPQYLGSTIASAGVVRHEGEVVPDVAPYRRATRARDKGWLVPSQDAYWFAPVPRPGKIVCVGLNYRDHAAESGLAVPENPVIFSKFSTCVIAPGERVVIPRTSERVDYEAELAVVIGRHAKHVRADRAYYYVLGYTLL